MGNGIECELEGVANGFATPSLKLRRPRDLRLEAVPHHKLHYIQTAINQGIIFQTVLKKQLSFFKLCERQQNSYSIEQDRESQNAIFGVN